MWLLIDAGNTRIKWALAEKLRPLSPWQPHNDIDAGWLATGAVTHADMTTLAGLWQGRGITQVVVSNVAGVAAREQLAQLLQQAVAPAPTALHWFSSVALAAGLRNGYRDPNQLGGDRFASLIGARALFPAQALIVATCGTATTIDAVNAAGDFIGGMILPGLALMAASLARNTAQLPYIDASRIAPQWFADHTDAAIASGCLSAQAGAIERACMKHSGARCVMSGGAAAAIAPALSVPNHLVDNLVLLGLQTAYTFSPSC